MAGLAAAATPVRFSGDLQSLMHQLVFETKVHSALHGSAFGSLLLAQPIKL